MADVEYPKLPDDGFEGITRNDLIHIASQVWEYRFGGDRAKIIRAMRDDFETENINCDQFTFTHEGETHIICDEDVYLQYRNASIESMVEMAQDDIDSSLVNCGSYVAPYLKFDEDAFVRDLDINGDIDAGISGWDGVVEQLYTIILIDDKYYRGDGLYTWRID
ncbi:MAG: hypothetical protein CMA63_06120 [Euryarchaeota archaeon]|nr:hypothetical protein [Euryarchaeota archaeon]